jgi:serine/threonine protein phosphatase PrpC
VTVRLRWGAVTDTGRVRAANEDSILVADPLFVVADGMGGHAAGEVASNVAVATLRQAFDDEHPPTTEGIVEAVRQANRDIVRQSLDEPELRGMGTTVTGVALTGTDDAVALVVFNVGDSRTYRLHEGELTRVTIDHSYVQELVDRGEITLSEARIHPNRNIVTRALGIDEDIEVDTSEQSAIVGDRYLACSDGLVDELDDSEILDVLTASPDPQVAADELTRRANAAGGRDNVSVIVVDLVDDETVVEPTAATGPVGGWLGDEAPPLDTSAVPGPTSPPEPQPTTPVAKRSRKLRVGTVLVAVIAVLGVAFGAIVWYGKGAYYVGFEGDQVVVYQGRPGGVLWIDPEQVGTYPLERGDLTEAGISRIEAEPTFSSRADADAYVANLEADPAAVIPPTTTTSSTTTTSTTTTTTTTTTLPPTTVPPPPAAPVP